MPSMATRLALKYVIFILLINKTFSFLLKWIAIRKTALQHFCNVWQHVLLTYNKTFNFQVKFVGRPSVYEPTICHFTISTKRVSEGSFNGYLTNATISHITLPDSSYSDVNMRLKTVHDVSGNVKMETGAEAVRSHHRRREGPRQHFWDYRLEVNKTSSTYPPFVMASTMTTNWWQVQQDVFGDNMTHAEMNTMLLRPSKLIPMEKLQYNNQTQIRISKTDEEYWPAIHYFNMSMSETAEGEESLTVDFGKADPTPFYFGCSNKSDSIYRMIMRRMPRLCPHCHIAEIRFPYIHMSSHISNSSTNRVFKIGAELDEELFMDIFEVQGITSYLREYAASDRKIKLEIMEKKEDRVENDRNYYSRSLGYTVGQYALESNVTIVNVENIFDERDFKVTANFTCHYCIPLTGVKFNTIGTYEHRILPEDRVPEGIDGYEEHAEFTYSTFPKHKRIAKFDQLWHFRDDVIEKCITKVDYTKKTYGPALSNVVFPEPEKMTIEATIDIRTPEVSDNSISYDVNITSDNCSTWLGFFRMDQVNPESNLDVCEADSNNCQNITLDLRQVG